MSIPNYQEFMLPTLEMISDGAEYKNSEMALEVAKKLNLSESEMKEMLPSGTQEVFYNRAGWARTYLKKADLLRYPKRGIMQITDLGKKVLESKPQKIDVKFLKQFENFNTFFNNKKQEETGVITNTTDEELETPDEMIENARTILSAHLESDLLSNILENSPMFFEKLVAKLLFKMGYGGSEKDILQSCGKSGDGGIDGIINQDVLGLDQIHIQAKRYKSDNIVQVGALRDFCGALYGKKNPKGVFITTSSFTKPAIEFAQDNDLILIDGRKLTKLMIEYTIGVQVKDVIEIKKIDNDFFEENI